MIHSVTLLGAITYSTSLWRFARFGVFRVWKDETSVLAFRARICFLNANHVVCCFWYVFWNSIRFFLEQFPFASIFQHFIMFLIFFLFVLLESCFILFFSYILDTFYPFYAPIQNIVFSHTCKRTLFCKKSRYCWNNTTYHFVYDI